MEQAREVCTGVLVVIDRCGGERLNSGQGGKKTRACPLTRNGFSTRLRMYFLGSLLSLSLQFLLAHFESYLLLCVVSSFLISLYNRHSFSILQGVRVFLDYGGYH